MKTIYRTSLLTALIVLALGMSPAAAGGMLRASGSSASPPLLSITTESGSPPGDTDEAGTLTITEYDEAGAAHTRTTPVLIRLRGNTSRRFPKKSFRVKIVDEAGQKQNLSIAGLRSDDDWILNPMYSDTSKIREALSYWLWDEINSSGQAAASSRGAYAEVELNGDHHGLYFIQERIDRKQVDADKHLGILYKITANERPTAGELLECTGEECGGIELAFSGKNVASPWEPAADYIALLDSAAAAEEEDDDDGDDENGAQAGPLLSAASPAARLSLENTIDYGLWSMLVQARDGHFKNQYMHCVPTDMGYLLYRIPWDLNHTFGDLWDASSPETNYLTYRVAEPAMDDVFSLLLEQDGAQAESFRTAVRDRWLALRETSLTEERLIARAQELFAEISDALQRDTKRWPECGMGDGNAANIRDIEDYIREILPFMDTWAGELPQTERR